MIKERNQMKQSEMKEENKCRRRQKDRKVSDGQPASKHGKQSHKNGCNDE